MIIAVFELKPSLSTCSRIEQLQAVIPVGSDFLAVVSYDAVRFNT